MHTYIHTHMYSEAHGLYVNDFELKYYPAKRNITTTVYMYFPTNI